MIVYVNRKPHVGPWGGGNLLVKAFVEEATAAGHKVVYDIQDSIGAMLLLDPRYGNTRISVNEMILYKSKNTGTKFLHRVNECDARKLTTDVDSMLRECSRYTDKTIFVSNWMKDYHLHKGWQCNNNSVIYNGIDKSHFRPREKLENGKINIVTHHWSNNPLKGFDFYEKIDKFVSNNSSYTFTYIGRDRGTFSNTKLVPPLFGLDLGKELAKYDVYVSGTRSDPGPNHILESISCDIPTYTFSEGGGAVEFAGEDHTFNSWKELLKILESKNFTKNSMSIDSWKDCVNKYLEEIVAEE